MLTFYLAMSAVVLLVSFPIMYNRLAFQFTGLSVFTAFAKWYWWRGVFIGLAWPLLLIYFLGAIAMHLVRVRRNPK